MGIIRDILSQVDDAVDTIAVSGFANGADVVGDIISIGGVLLLILLGLNVVLQLRPMTFGSGFAFGTKLILVALFAQSWSNFSVIYDITTTVPNSIGASILDLTDSGDEAGVYESLDRMVNRITAYGDAIGDRAGLDFWCSPWRNFFRALGSFRRGDRRNHRLWKNHLHPDDRHRPFHDSGIPFQTNPVSL